MKMLNKQDLNNQLEHNKFVKLTLFTQKEVEYTVTFDKNEIEVLERKLNARTNHETSNSSNFKVIKKVNSVVKLGKGNISKVELFKTKLISYIYK